MLKVDNDAERNTIVSINLINVSINLISKDLFLVILLNMKVSTFIFIYFENNPLVDGIEVELPADVKSYEFKAFLWKLLS